VEKSGGEVCLCIRTNQKGKRENKKEKMREREWKEEGKKKETTSDTQDV
jgi:hypothetical protein